MKMQVGELIGKIRDFRNGDRVVTDNSFSMNTTVYKKSEKDKPYFSIGVDGRFQLTMIELLLIAMAGTIALTLLMTALYRRVTGLLHAKTKKA